MERFDLQLQTMVAELQERVHLRTLLELPFGGAFYKRHVNGRGYWYHRTSHLGRPVNRYIGLADPELDERIAGIRQSKPALRQQRELVRMLRRAGYPGPEPFVGSIVQALAEASLFRLRGCLIGRSLTRPTARCWA